MLSFNFLDQQLPSDVAKENCLSNGNVQHAVRYGSSFLPR